VLYYSHQKLEFLLIVIAKLWKLLYLKINYRKKKIASSNYLHLKQARLCEEAVFFKSFISSLLVLFSLASYIKSNTVNKEI